MATVKKIPTRLCIGCQEQHPKKELVRIVRSPEGDFSVDLTGKKAGRGAYICNNNIFIRSIPSLAIQVLIEDLTGIYSIFTNIDKTILYGTNRIGSEIYVIKDESQN